MDMDNNNKMENNNFDSNNNSYGFTNNPESPESTPGPDTSSSDTSSADASSADASSANTSSPDASSENSNNSSQTAPGKPVAKKKKAKLSSGTKKVVAAVVACAVVGCASGIGGGAIYSEIQEESKSTTIYEASETTSDVSTASVDSGSEMTTEEIYATYVNSCVGITSDVTETNVFGMTTTGVVSGSGFIISEDGYIVTNEHVVSDGSNYTVTMYDGTTYSATLVGSDETNDVAVLKIDATGLTPVVLGDSDSLVVGEEVCTIGNPLGELTFSLTSGVVSALDREVTVSTGVTMNLLQTDCAINSGNSGGPLFDKYGNVVGITNAKYSSDSSSGSTIDNIGFAIPINQVKDVITEIIEKGYVSTPYLGISGETISEQVADQYGMVVGGYVYSVESGSCSEEAGIQRGDIITAFDGTEVTSIEDLNYLKNQHEPGDTVTLTINRNGEEIQIEVTLDEKPTDTTSSSTDQQQSINQDSNYWYWYGNGN